MSIGTFKERARRALGNDALKRAVMFSTTRLRDGRYHAAAQVEWEALRTKGQAIRKRCVANLPANLDRFVAKVRAAGGYVHMAADADQATRIVRDLAKARGVQRVVKSKSMISEEIHLNQHLEADGIEVVETDLGEYIVQLAGEIPSHIITPALHKSRREVAELLSRQAGEPLDDDTITLTAFARRRLREEFLRADMGITGCNFGVAESGSVCIVTNEGNGRMVTTLPRIQVTLMGMERLVETFEDLDVMLDLLPRAATGQKLTSYVNIMTGPRRDDELDGPEELHVVILDNGRSQLLGTEFEEALHCIRCGACFNVCPVYRQVGGHAYGSTYAGPIGAVITPLLKGVERWGELAHASSLCGACYDACPVKIPLHDLLIQIRRLEAEGVVKAKGKGAERLAFRGWRIVMESPRLYRLLLRLGRLAQRPVVRQGRIRWAPPPLGGWLAGRDLPALPTKSFRERWAELEAEKPQATMADKEHAG